MGASDAILSALVGVLEGSQKGVNMFLEDAMARRRQREQAQQEFDIYKQKLPLQEESALRTAQGTSDIELRQRQALIPTEEASAIRRTKAAQLPTYVKDASGRTIEKVDGKVQFLPTIGDQNAKPLTTEAKKVSGNLEDGIRSLDEALKIQERRPNINIKTGLNLPLVGNLPARVASYGDADAQRYIREITNASDTLARFRTGAAINNQELETYGRLLNDSLTTPTVARENLQKVRAFMLNVSYDIRSGKRAYSENLPSESSNQIEEFPDE